MRNWPPTTASWSTRPGHESLVTRPAWSGPSAHTEQPATRANCPTRTATAPKERPVSPSSPAAATPSLPAGWTPTKVAPAPSDSSVVRHSGPATALRGRDLRAQRGAVVAHEHDLDRAESVKRAPRWPLSDDLL